MYLINKGFYLHLHRHRGIKSGTRILKDHLEWIGLESKYRSCGCDVSISKFQMRKRYLVMVECLSNLICVSQTGKMQYINVETIKRNYFDFIIYLDLICNSVIDFCSVSLSIYIRII